MPGDGFDPWITLKKFGTGLFYAGVPFVLLYSIQFIETEEFPPEVAIWIPIIAAALHAIVNAWKHWKDQR